MPSKELEAPDLIQLVLCCTGGGSLIIALAERTASEEVRKGQKVKLYDHYRYILYYVHV